MKHFNRFFNSTSSSTGFTFLEFLVASATGLIVLSGLGYAAVSVINNSTITSKKVERRQDMKSSLDLFIEEIEYASRVNGTDGDATDEMQAADTNLGNFNLDGDELPIAALEIGDVGNRILYYAKPAASNQAWSNLVLYRFGPKPDYSNADDPTSWTSAPVLDLIEDANNVTPNCQAGWVANPDPATYGVSNQIPGVYTCVNPTRRLVKISINGLVETDQGYKETTNLTTIANAKGSSVFSSGGLVPSFRHDGDGVLKVDGPTKITIKSLNGSITCEVDSEEVPITTEVFETYENGTPINDQGIEVSTDGSTTIPGTSFTGNIIVNMSIGEGSCSVGYDSTDTNQMEVLYNGNPLPEGHPALEDPDVLSDFLDQYVDENGNIAIEDNQVLILGELTDSDPANNGFDMQDSAALVSADYLPNN